MRYLECMAFAPDLPKAARRHIQAADILNGGHRRDVAGYLYGIAAECAIKQLTIPIPMAPQHDKKAILYSHFPELRTRLRDAISGRNTSTLARFIYNDAFLNNWDIGMRYSNGTQIRSEWIDTWAQQANAVVSAMGT